MAYTAADAAAEHTAACSFDVVVNGESLVSSKTSFESHFITLYPSQHF